MVWLSKKFLVVGEALVMYHIYRVLNTGRTERYNGEEEMIG
jgi:hypothetical protein